MRIIKVLLIQVLISLLLLEVALRLQEPYFHLMAKGDHESPNNLIVTQYHPVWNHQVRPNLHDLELRVKDDEEMGYSISTNRWGCRYNDITMPKPKNTYRIIVIGDSFTFGYHQEDTVAVKLERQLNLEQSTLRFEVINCASGSYSPVLMYLRIRDHLLGINPDAIIINIDQTDLYDEYWRYRNRTVLDENGDVLSVKKRSWKTIEAAKVLMEYSTAVRTVVSVFHRTFLALGIYDRGSNANTRASTYENIYSFHTMPSDSPEWQGAFSLVEENVNRIIHLCRTHGLACAFSTYPHVNQVGVFGQTATQHREFTFRLENLFERHGLFFYDAYPAIAAAMDDGQQLYFTHDMHLNELGQKVWSAAFSKAFTPWVVEQVNGKRQAL